MTEIEELKAQIKVLQSKLSFLEELEKTKSPVEEAYKECYGMYPRGDAYWEYFKDGYNAAQKDYKVGEYQEPEEEQEKDWEIKVETDYRTGKARHKTRIVDKDGNDYKPEPITTEELLKPKWEPKSQSEEEVAEGLKSAFQEAVKQGIIHEVDKVNEVFMNEMVAKLKGQTLYDLIADWWDEIFVNGNPSGQNIESLVEQIEKWLPKEQSAAGSQNAYVECTVEGFNDCLDKIKRKLR